ncbi:MAG: hypothetical protein K2F92_05605 [Alistipes sp.]|nr:hypothetical protein [Alistipes sp.]
MSDKILLSPDVFIKLSRVGRTFLLVDLFAFVVFTALLVTAIINKWIAFIGIIVFLIIRHSLKDITDWITPQLNFCLLFTNKNTVQEIEYVSNWAHEMQYHQPLDNKTIQAICLLIFSDRKFYKKGLFRRSNTKEYMSLFFSEIPEYTNNK